MSGELIIQVRGKFCCWCNLRRCFWQARCCSCCRYWRRPTVLVLAATAAVAVVHQSRPHLRICIVHIQLGHGSTSAPKYYERRAAPRRTVISEAAGRCRSAAWSGTSSPVFFVEDDATHPLLPLLMSSMTAAVAVAAPAGIDAQSSTKLWLASM